MLLLYRSTVWLPLSGFAFTIRQKWWIAAMSVFELPSLKFYIIIIIYAFLWGESHSPLYSTFHTYSYSIHQSQHFRNFEVEKKDASIPGTWKSFFQSFFPLICCILLKAPSLVFIWTFQFIIHLYLYSLFP